jgi:methylamine dehydrogenase heavy chain
MLIRLWAGGVALMMAAASVLANLDNEPMFITETMPDRQGGHTVVLADFAIPFAADGRSHIFDADTGVYLGGLSTGFWHSGVMLPRNRNIIVSPETYFSRGTRGERTDVVVFYDGTTLKPVSETKIPPKRFTAVKMQGTSAINDDGRFAVILNHTPAASISVVDLDSRQFVTEIDIPGCFNIYPVGHRVINAICGHGGFMTIALDASGLQKSITRSETLFDAMTDPITVSGVRVADTWYYVSKGGNFYGFDFKAGVTNKVTQWPLFNKQELQDNWRISGFQHLAIHRNSGRVFVLVHQGDPETFEDPGTHVWIYDLDSGEKLEERELQHMALSIEVSQDDNAQMYALAANFHISELAQIYVYLTQGERILEAIMDFVLDVYDAEDGSLQRTITEVGQFPSYIQVWPATETTQDGS